MSLPQDVIDKIAMDAIILHRDDSGWRDLHRILKGRLFIKKTDNVFSPEIRFERVQRVDSFYSEDKPMYTWTRPHQRLQNLYVYGNPFPSYSFC